MKTETDRETEIRLSQERIRETSDKAIEWLRRDRARALELLGIRSACESCDRETTSGLPLCYKCNRAEGRNAL